MIHPSQWPLLKKLTPAQYEVLTYLATGAWNTLFGVGLYTVVYHVAGARCHYLLLTIPVNVLAITNAFLCYKLLVFRTKGHWFREYFRCYLVYGGGSLLGMGLLWLLVHFCCLRPDLANVLSTVIVMIASFLGHKFFSFRKGN